MCEVDSCGGPRGLRPAKGRKERTERSERHRFEGEAKRLLSKTRRAALGHGSIALALEFSERARREAGLDEGSCHLGDHVLLRARTWFEAGALCPKFEHLACLRSKIRLRGVNSLALNNDPIIILDGVRLNAQTTVAANQPNAGSAQMLSNDGLTGSGSTLAPSRLDDIDPNTIESIDVLRGPSASSLYGTDAANGVIVIKTRRGQPGSWHLNLPLRCACHHYFLERFFKLCLTLFVKLGINEVLRSRYILRWYVPSVVIIT